MPPQTPAPPHPRDAAQVLAAALVAERGHPATWRPAPCHPDLALAVIDAVMSPRVRGETVAAIIDRYLEHGSEHDTTADLAATFRDLGHDAWQERIGTRHRTTARLDAPYKSLVISQAAVLLVTLGIHSADDLHARANNADVRQAWCALPGQSGGTTWRHLLLTSGYRTPTVCPLTRRFVRRHLGHTAAAQDASALTALAHEVAGVLHTGHLAVDHQMWRAANAPRPRVPITLSVVRAESPSTKAG